MFEKSLGKLEKQLVRNFVQVRQVIMLTKWLGYRQTVVETKGWVTAEMKLIIKDGN